MDPFLIFLSVVIGLLALVLIIAGIYVILILRHLHKTLIQANRAITSAEQMFFTLSHPLTDVKSLAQGIKTGLSVAEMVARWVKTRKEQEDGPTS